MSFKVTPLHLMTVLCVYVSSGYSTMYLLVRWYFFKGLQNYMENKNEENENKIILRGFNCNKGKIDRYGGNKTQILYRCCSYYALNVIMA